MVKDFSRSQRVAEQILRDLADLVRRELKDPRVGFITLTDVEVTPDYAYAKVYFTAMDGDARLPEILKGLQAAKGFLRRELGKRIRIHTLPDLSFHYDSSIDYGSRMSLLIDKVVHEDEARQDAAHDQQDDSAQDEASSSY